MENKFKHLLEKYQQENLFPGAVAAWKTPQSTGVTAIGQVTYDSSSTNVTPQTLYDVASITKSIPTSCLAIFLAEQGRLDLEALVTHYLSDYRGEYADQLTVRHLVEFRAPFALQLSQLKTLPAEDLLEKILTAPMLQPPGGEPAYINTTSILLTLVIEAVTDESIDSLADTLFFAPLSMADTTFSPPAHRTAPTEIDPWRHRPVRGEVHDESAWKLQEIMVPGSAGLFSTAPDLLTFATMLLHHGTIHQNTFFSPHSVEQMRTGLGWERRAEWMGTAPAGTFGKTGFTGCCIVINEKNQTTGVLLSNSIWPQRSIEKQDKLKKLRQEFCNILFS